MVAESLPFKTCEKCFASAYDVSDFFGNSYLGDITGPYLRPELGKALAVLIIHDGSVCRPTGTSNGPIARGLERALTFIQHKEGE